MPTTFWGSAVASLARDYLIPQYAACFRLINHYIRWLSSYCFSTFLQENHALIYIFTFPNLDKPEPKRFELALNEVIGVYSLNPNFFQGVERWQPLFYLRNMMRICTVS